MEASKPVSSRQTTDENKLSTKCDIVANDVGYIEESVKKTEASHCMYLPRMNGQVVSIPRYQPKNDELGPRWV